MNSHEVHVFENGTASIRNTVLGETMHSSVGADEEARGVYLDQSRLVDRLMTPSPEPLVLFDVGMGIATNALTALEAKLACPQSRPLQIISFENSLEGLELALAQPEQFPLQARHRSALEGLLRSGRWQSPDPGIFWELRRGDFLEQRLDPAPEVIFYDFYSPKSSPELWRKTCFSRLFQACHQRRERGLPTVLTTYSAATPVRSALLLAGFHVGRGIPTDLKAETTIATTELSELAKPLDRDWLEKLSRSSKPLPSDIDPELKAEALDRIRSARQFRAK